MHETQHDLGTIQRWMQSVITHPGGVLEGMNAPEALKHIAIESDQLESVVTRSKSLDSVDRLEIYARAYYARLIECLRAEFPVLVKAVGEEVFDEFAVGYLQRHPSRSYTLNRLGGDFPLYLAETRPAGESWAEVLVDLTTLESAIGDVFDGPGAEGSSLIDADELAAIPAERWPGARLIAVPCVRTLSLQYPVRAYYTALREDDDLPPPAAAPSFLALTRRDYVVRIHDLAPLEYKLLNALLEGLSVGEAVGLVAEAAGPELDNLADDIRLWFGNWAAAGFFRSVELPPSADA